MCEIYIFRSLMFLMEFEKDVDIYKNDFYKLIKDWDNSLPIDFCLDLLEQKEM
jgi:hypothetical protein